MLFCFVSKGQTLFNKRIKKNNAATGATSVLLNNNKFILLGSEYYNYGTSYNFRYLTLKIDSIGDTLYTKSYGKNKFDYYCDDWGGGTKLGNYYYDYAAKTDSLNNIRSLLYKFNSNGDTIFTKLYSDTSLKYGFAVKVTRNKNLVLFGSSDTLDPNYDYCLLLTDTLGNIKFKKHYGTLNPEDPCIIDTCKDGGFIMGGWRQLPGANNYIAYVVKTDSLGNAQWQNTYGNYSCQSIFSCKEGGYLITADYKDSVIGGEVFNRANLIKINNVGGVVWDKKYGASAYGENSIISYELSNHDIITCGTVGHINNPPVNSYNYGVYGYIMRTDSSGNLKFYQTYQATTFQGAQNYLRDIKPLPDGGFIAVGFVQPYDGTSQDVWVLRVDSNGCEVPGCALNTGIEQFVASSNQLTVYPNPTNEILNVQYSVNDPTCTDATLQLIEMGTGRILLTKKVPCNSTQTQIDLNEFANGVYSLSIQSNLNAPKVIRIVKVQ